MLDILKAILISEKDFTESNYRRLQKPWFTEKATW